MRKLIHILVSISAMLWLSSCEQLKEIEDASAVEEGKDVVVRINYGSNVDEVRVTKAGLTPTQESAVYSIYVMTFNQNGARTNNADDALFYRTDTQTSDRTWEDTSDENNYSEGYIQFNAKTGANTTVYAVANVNTPEMTGLYSLSSADLDKVTTLDELKSLIVGLNTKAVSRGSQMMMMGVLKDSEGATEPKTVTINSSESVQEFGTLYFERLDAKVIFNVSVQDGVDAEFALHTWQVFNVPFNAHLVPANALGGGLSPDDGLQVFNTPTSNQFDNGNSFTFYMLENNLSPETELTDYSQREAKNKGESGAYEITDGSWTWQYAPKQSTYVQIKGRLTQKVTTDADGVTDLIHADVVYNVHLGDFGSSVNDFWTKANTQYTYNIYIAGINNIRTEVVTSNDDEVGITETQPGAEGNVVVASGAHIYEVDAHYAQLIIPFTYNETFINAMGGANSIDDLTWYVSTPYSEGTYEEGANNDETKHYDETLLDYKWAEFYINSTNQMVTYGEYLKWLYDKGRATLSGVKYIKTNPLYIDEFVSELKTWYNYMNGTSDQTPNLITSGAQGSEQTIYVTIFVNEFYYDEGNPLSTTDNDVTAMVRKVVNGEDRYMHILSNVDYSADGASSVTNSAATIIQKPIRSIYNIPDFGLIDGYNLIWGTETISEQYGNADDFGFLYGSIQNSNANSSFNGRYNQSILWNNASWSDKMTITDNVWTMTNAQTASANPAVYACLARNRDENGNGTVDTDEMKWYMAAIDQLQYLYIGENVIHPDAKLLSSSIATAHANKFKYLSSTYTSVNNGGGYVLWAEEGLSTSGNLNGWADDPYSYEDHGHSQNSQWVEGKTPGFVRRPVRCLRNLGVDDNVGTGMSSLFDVSNNIISPVYMNPDALRSEKWTGVTLVHKDNTSLNLPYLGGFEYYTSDTDLGGTSLSNAQLIASIESGDDCPEGYRIPNQRELALLYIANVRPNYTSGYWWSASYNWYKSGTDSQILCAITSTTATVTTPYNGGNNHTRCIRDVDAASASSVLNDGGSLTE